jgi:hypothetical protein
MVINKYVGKLCLVDVKEMQDIISRDTISYLRTYDDDTRSEYKKRIDENVAMLRSLGVLTIDVDKC